MSDNWNPPPGRDEPEQEGEQPTEPPAQPPSHRDGQSPQWWTESTEKPTEYLQPGPPASAPQPPASPNKPQNGPATPPPQSGQPNRPTPQSGPPTPNRPNPQGGGSAPNRPNPQGGGSAPDRPTPQGGPATPNRPSGPGGWTTPNQPPYAGQQGPGGQHSAPPPSTGPTGSGSTWPGPSNAGSQPPSNSTWPGPSNAAGGSAQGGPTPPQSPWSTTPQGGGGQPNPWSAAAGSSYPPGGPQGGQGGFQGFPPNAPNQGGQPSWQYPPIPIPKPPGGGRRRKPRRTPKGLLIVLVVLAVLVVGSGVTYALRNSGDDTKTTATDTPSVTPSETPSATPSETPSPTPTPTPTKTPPKPRQPTAYELVAKNKIYTVGPLQASKCTEPPYRPTTFAAVKAYYNRMLPCLNRTWWLAMQKAGMPFRAPHVIVYANTVKTPCGVERGTRGFYCGANEAIYMPFNVDYKNYKVNPLYTRAWMLNTFAHEYGHHVQQLTGIFGASFARQATMADPNQRLLESRKRELQASCFGSAYLGADAQFVPMKGELLTSWKFAVANAGDEFSKPVVRDHGAKVNHNFWSTRGITYKDPRFCNTFQSPPQFTY